MRSWPKSAPFVFLLGIFIRKRKESRNVKIPCFGAGKHDSLTVSRITTVLSVERELTPRLSSAIQRDFATGIKELDQEVAEEIDEASFNPEEDQRDYNEVARSLPVFCVSSRAYQKLSGRFKRDKAVLGFSAPDQTEVSQ